MPEMQILYPNQYRSFRMCEELAQKAQDRLLPNMCLVCDTPLSRVGPCQTCNAPFLIGIVNIEDPLYVQLHTEPMRLAFYEKARETRQRYICLSCDGRIDTDGYCSVCDAKTTYCFHYLRGRSKPCIRPDAIPLCSDYEHAFANPLEVRLIESSAVVVDIPTSEVVGVNTPESQTPESQTPETDSVNTSETDRQRIRRLRQRLSLREIKAETGFSLGKIRHHLKD